MSKMLASVANLDEALEAMRAEADIIDLKAPASGSLGALPLASVREIVTAIAGKCPVSATIGDLPMEPVTVFKAVETLAMTGVDFAKIGFFPGGDCHQTLAALRRLAEAGVSMVAVLFGDQKPELELVKAVAEARFVGVMLDTMDKRAGSLTQVCTADYLVEFIAKAKTYGLLSGLAGSLRPNDIPALLDLHPDYLGFRGALCRHHERTASLDPDSARSIRRMIPVGSKSDI